MKKILLITALLAFLTGVNAQKEANHWYFGEYAGVNFGLGVPIPLTDGQLTTGEGCSSISTSSGNLLFYTDGTTVWNKNHQVMENGTGLHGSYTGGQGPFGYQWEPESLAVNPNVLESQTANLASTKVFTLYVTDESAQCTGSQSVIVYVTGGPLIVTATAEDPQLCLGESTTLHALPSGGTGDYSYSWTSNPGTFTSDLQSPAVMPDQTTTYYVELYDSLSYANAEVTVVVNQHPEANAGTDQTIDYGTTTILMGSATGGSGIGFDLKTFSLRTETPDGCTFIDEISVLFDFGLCFGTEELDTSPVVIYPNPGKGTFSFEGIKESDWSELRIFNAQMQQVHYEKFSESSGTNTGMRRDLSFLPPGIYFISLTNDGSRAAGKLMILP